MYAPTKPSRSDTRTPEARVAPVGDPRRGRGALPRPAGGRHPVGGGAGRAPSVPCVSDGLVERRGESLDVGLERLRGAAAEAGHRPVGDLGGAVVHAHVADRDDDDTVLLGVRWPS